MSDELDKESAERIGLFIDGYVKTPDNNPVPRNIPYFKEAFRFMLKNGMFRTKKEIVLQCLRTQRQMIPDFLFDQ